MALRAATAYQQLLGSIPTGSFPVRDSTSVLSSVYMRIEALKAAIKSLPLVPERPFYQPSGNFANLTYEYLGLFSLPKATILNNLEQALTFVTSPLKLTPEDYQLYLGLDDVTFTPINRRLPLKTVEVFHAYACGRRMEDKEFLGNGHFGAVYKKLLGGIPFACKEGSTFQGAASKDKQKQENIQEACAYSVLDHPNILKLFALTFEPHRLYLEYANSKTLKHLIDNQPQLENNFRIIDPSLRFKLFSQIADALSYIHGEGYTHCDFKDDNVMIHDGNAKIGDLSFMTYTKNNKNTLLTPHYAAPETLQEVLLSEKLDVWSFATLLYCTFKNHIPYPMFTHDGKELPWDDYRKRLYKHYYDKDDKPAVLARIFKEAQKHLWDQYDPGGIFRGLIGPCLHGTPEKRWSMMKAKKYLASNAGAFQDSRRAPQETKAASLQSSKEARQATDKDALLSRVNASSKKCCTIL